MNVIVLDKKKEESKKVQKLETEKASQKNRGKKRGVGEVTSSVT